MPDGRRRLEQELGALRIAPERLHDLIEELAQDLEERARVARSAGASAAEADAQAWAGLGSIAELKARLEEVEGWSAAARQERERPLGRHQRAGPGSGLVQDLRQATRSLRRSPGFVLTATLALGIGIGAHTALFSVVNALFLTPLPVADPERIVAVYTSDFSGARLSGSSRPDFEDLRAQPELFESLAAYAFEAIALMTDREPARVWSELVSGDYFATVGLPLALGRPLGPSDDREGAAPAVVIGHGLWQRRFAGDPAILGRVLNLSGAGFTVVGVAPEAFAGMTRGLLAEAWLPLRLRGLVVPGGGEPGRGSRFLSLVGRLPAGLGLEEAQARLDVAAERLREAYPDEWTDHAGQTRRLSVLPETRARVPHRAFAPLLGFSAVLGTVVSLLLLIAFANVANLMLARASTRRREIAVRLALGASRGRIVRHFVAESLLVVALGGALGTLLAAWGAGALRSLRLPLPVPVFLDPAIDARVLLFALALTLVTGVLLGLVPALQTLRSELASALKEDGAGQASGPHGRRLRRAFVAAQLALSMVLLVGASLLVRGLARATELSLGLAPEAVQLLPVDFGLAGYGAPETTDLIERLAERAAALPGVETAALTMTLPVELHVARRGTYAEGHVPQPGEDTELYFGVVGPGHFEAFGIPILRGREFRPDDREDGPGVTIVNETFTARFWPGEDPIGKTLRLRSEDAPPLSVVGLAKDSTYRRPGEEPMPFYYLPLTQDAAFVQRFARLFPLHVAVRAPGDPAGATSAVRTALAEIDPGLPVYPPRSMVDHLGVSVLPARAASAAFTAFGLVGLLLACLGVYGVAACSVAQRTQEIGLRMALGARGQDVMRLVLADGLRLLAAGLLVGTLLGAALARALAALLYGLPPLDLPSFVLVPLALAAVTLAASLLPARRAMRLDPVAALRCE